MTAPVICETMDSKVRPVACSMRSKMISPNMANDPMQHMVR